MLGHPHKKTYYPHGAVNLLGDTNCLKHSVSEGLFDNENKWDLIKLGSLSYLRSKTGAVLEHVRYGYFAVKYFATL